MELENKIFNILKDDTQIRKENNIICQELQKENDRYMGKIREWF